MPDPLINRRLGRYQIHQEIGRGGMARVYRATDTLLQRQVALKILAPQLSNDPDFARRFEREAITAANLRHPGIITIFDVGEADGLRYIAMEYIAGRTLNEVLTERGKLGLSLAVAVLQPVAEALQYAHSQGAVHRDVKPHNILIDSDGRVLLTDFGIAVGPKAGSERLTQAGMFMGTPEYLSPEQAQAQPPVGRSDLYSLGIVAWECLTGRVPFEGGAPQLIMAHVYTPAPAITSVDPSLPPELDQTFARALAKDPEARFAKAIEFTEALRTIALRHGLPAASREEVAALALPAGSSAGQATVVLATPPGIAPASSAPPQAFPIGDIFGPPPAATKAPIAEIFGDPAQRRTAAAQPAPTAGTAHTIRPAQDAAGTPGTVPAVPPPAGAPQNRRQTPREMVYPRGEPADDYVPPPPPRRSTYSSGRIGGLPWAAIVVGLIALLLVGLLVLQSTGRARSGAGKGNGGSLQAVFGPTAVTAGPGAPTATQSPTESPPTPVPTQKQPVAAAPPATQAAAETPPPPAETAASPTAVPPTATAPPPTAPPPTEPPPPTATTAPTQLPATQVPPTATALPPTATIAPAVTVSATSGPSPEATTAAPAAGPTPPGGGVALVFQSGPAINLFDIGASSGTQIAPAAQPIGPAAIAPDGSSILFDAVKDNARHIYRFDKAAGTVAEFLQSKGDDYQPAWSADGSQIVYTSTQDGNPEIYRADSTGKQLERLTNDPGEDDYASFSPDGKQIVWESRRNKRWEIFIMSQDELHHLVEPAEGRDDRYPRLSPDGTQVVFASNRDRADGGYELYLQQLPDGIPHRLTNFGVGSARGPQWSPDGKMIVFFSNARGNDDIYQISATGGTPRAFGSAETDERWPVWGR